MKHRPAVCIAILLTVLTGPLAWAVPTRFSDALYEKFMHERCLACHQFNNRKSNGRAYFSHRNRYLCDRCHTPAITGLKGGEWQAPAGDRMDYTGLSARETCLLIKRNTPTGDRDRLLLEHLLHDDRIRWALDSGRRPDGKAATVPGGLKEWERDVKNWAEGGLSCD